MTAALEHLPSRFLVRRTLKTAFLRSGSNPNVATWFHYIAPVYISRRSTYNRNNKWQGQRNQISFHFLSVSQFFVDDEENSTSWADVCPPCEFPWWNILWKPKAMPKLPIQCRWLLCKPHYHIIEKAKRFHTHRSLDSNDWRWLGVLFYFFFLSISFEIMKLAPKNWWNISCSRINAH